MTNKELIEAEIESYLQSFNHHKLYKPVKYLLQLNGKRIRPSILIDSTSIFGGNVKEAIPIAIAVEVFHNFTLMHDDIMDNSSLRRGKPTVHEKWDVNSAILSGDAMMIMAYQLIEKIPNEYKAKMYSAYNKMALWLCEGQQDDMDFEEKDSVEIPEYLNMIKNKTSVLIGFCFQAGAILGKADEETTQKIYAFGINLGLAFQLQDDFLDLFPKSKKMGKVVGGDLLNRKKSIPYLIAIQGADKTQEVEIKNLINSNQSNRVNELLLIFESLEVKKKTEEMIQDYFKKSIDSLDSIQGYDLSSLKIFAQNLLERIQ